MPLNNFAVSSRPVITGGRVGVGSGVGDLIASGGAKRCKRSSEIQRYMMALKIASNRRRTSHRQALTLSLGTPDYFFTYAIMAMMRQIALQVDIIPAGRIF